MASPVAQLDQIPVGGCHAVRVGSCPLVLFRPQADRVHALENRCPHEGYPLSTGRVADGRLTCEWHNWKFRLSDGVCEVGGEDVRTHPVELRDGQVYVTLAEPPAEELWARETRSLEKAFDEADFGHAARAVQRLLSAGRTPLEVLGFAARWSAARMTWGADHGLAASADYAEAISVGAGEPDLLLMDALHGLVEPNVRRPLAPIAPAAPQADEASLRRAIEDEALPEVEALLQAAPPREALGWLRHAATDHFLDYGHALIYVVRAERLLDAIGWEDATPILLALARSITYGTREDRLPYMRAAAQAFEAPFARLPALLERAHGRATVDVDALLDRLLGEDVRAAIDAVTAALEHGVAPTKLALVIALAAARRMLAFDVAHEHDDDVREGWLDVTHTLTHADAVHTALERQPTPELLRGLYHGARFVQHLGPLMGPDCDVETTATLDVVLAQQRVDEAAAAVRRARASGERVEETLRRLAFAPRTVLPLFTAHHVKTAGAALRVSAALCVAFPERSDHDAPLMAVARFLATPIPERRLHRRVKDARRLVREGRRPQTRLGY